MEKAFDSIEHNVLLNHLYKAGINGKAWRVIGAFYDQVEACVRVDLTYSAKFHLNRGVKVGAVLSPLLFLLVIGSLLMELESSGTGADIKGIYLGSLGHADNLRSITPNLAFLEQEASIVKKFTRDNGLQLNMDKLEFQEYSTFKPTAQSMNVGDVTIASSSHVTSLGVAWSHDLSPTMEIKSADTICVLPVCLYGSECWVLTETMIDTIENFQGDLRKKILNIPKHHSNLISLVALRWPTMRL